VFAVNGATGAVIWEYKSGLPGAERGVAVAGGRVLAALGGEHEVALNQQTGAVIWLTQVGTPGQDTAANGALAPGHSGSFRFVKPGAYYYNDCAGFVWNTGEIIVS
jgi:outer membrane protein assembly factor BamB